MIYKPHAIEIRPARYEALLVEKRKKLHWAACLRGLRKFWLIDVDEPGSGPRRTLAGHLLPSSILITMARPWAPRDEQMVRSALGARPAQMVRPRTLDLDLRFDIEGQWLRARPGQRLYVYCYRAPQWREVGEVGPGERFLVIGQHDIYSGTFAEEGVYIDEIWYKTHLLSRLLPTSWGEPPSWGRPPGT